MSRSFAPTLLYGGALLLLIAVAAAVFDLLDAATPALQGGAAMVLLLLAGFLALRDRGAPEAGDRTGRVIHDSSAAAAWIAVALALMALGAELGLWLVLIAAGMAVVGIGGLIRESRAARQAADGVLVGVGHEGKPTVGGEGRGPRTGELPGED